MGPTHLAKHIKYSTKAYALQLLNVEVHTKSEFLDPQIQIVLNEYDDVFKNPQGLPPKRQHDHSIPFIEKTPPVSLRPYRYPYFQKNEIEKIVQDLLKEGVIRPSTSPFPRLSS